MKPNDKRDLMNGFGDSLARAFEMAVTPGVFAFLGYRLDVFLGMVPVFTISLLLLALVGMFVRTWFEYDQKMKHQEAAATWSRGGVS